MKPIEIKLSVDTTPIDSLIAKLERAVELQKQLTQEQQQSKKATLANLIDVTPAVFGVVVSWNVWWPGKVRVYSKYRRGDETIEMCSQPISNSYQSYLVNGLPAGQDIECHVRFYDGAGKEVFRSTTVTGKASADACEILNAVPTGGYVGKGETYNIRMSISVDDCLVSGTIPAAKIESSLISNEQLKKDVAAIVSTVIENQKYIERVNHQREKDFVALSKAVRSVEESISRLSHRDSFIR